MIICNNVITNNVISTNLINYGYIFVCVCILYIAYYTYILIHTKQTYM